MKTLNGDYLDLGKNPYFASAVAAAEQPQTKQFMTQVLPGVTAQFEGAGRYGSGQQQAYTGLALDSLNQAQANAAAGMANTAYQGERPNQLNAANLAPTLANQDFANIALDAAGRPGDRREQPGADRRRTSPATTTNTTAQQNYISNYLQRLLAGYPGGESSGNGSVRSTPALRHVDAVDQPDVEHSGRHFRSRRSRDRGKTRGTRLMTGFNFSSGSIRPQLAAGAAAPEDGARSHSRSRAAAADHVRLPGAAGPQHAGRVDAGVATRLQRAGRREDPQHSLVQADPKPPPGSILNLAANPSAGTIGAPAGLPDPSDGLSGWGGSQAIDPLTGLLQDLGFGGGVETGGVADGGSLMSGLDPAGLSSGVAGLFGGGAAAAALRPQVPMLRQEVLRPQGPVLRAPKRPGSRSPTCCRSCGAGGVMERAMSDPASVDLTDEFGLRKQQPTRSLTWTLAPATGTKPTPTTTSRRPMARRRACFRRA